MHSCVRRKRASSEEERSCAPNVYRGKWLNWPTGVLTWSPANVDVDMWTTSVDKGRLRCAAVDVSAVLMSPAQSPVASDGWARGRRVNGDCGRGPPGSPRRLRAGWGGPCGSVACSDVGTRASSNRPVTGGFT